MTKFDYIKRAIQDLGRLFEENSNKELADLYENMFFERIKRLSNKFIDHDEEWKSARDTYGGERDDKE